MGVDYTCYIGPYIKVKNPNKNTTEKFPCCVIRKCAKYGKDAGDTIKFCPECGSKLGEHSRPTQTRLDFDPFEELKERMSEAMGEYRPGPEHENHFLISNIKGTPGESFDPQSGCFIKELTHQDSKTQILEFVVAFKKELDYLEKKFGESSVSVHYGILSWAW